MYKTISTDVFGSQHNVYSVLRRQEYLYYGQTKYMFTVVKLWATFNHTRKNISTPMESSSRLAKRTI